MKSKIRFALPVLLLCAVVLPMRLAAENVTWYKIRSDENGKPSWTKSYDGSHGWATDPAATAADTAMEVNDQDDFVIKGALQLRTPNNSTPFAGRSLTFTEGGSILLKTGSSNVTRTYEIRNLIVDGSGSFGQGTDKTRFNIPGNITLKPNSTLKLSHTTNSNSGDWRDIDIQAAITGDNTTVLDIFVSGNTANTSKCYLSGSMENFYGKVVSSSADSNGAKLSLFITNTFNGVVESLPKSTVLVMLDPGKMPSGKGLVCSSTTIPAALKTTLVFFSETFPSGNLVTFPSGTSVDPSEFDVRYRRTFSTSVDGTESSIAIKRVDNADGTVSIAVDEAAPTTAKIANVAGSWVWRFFDSSGNDVTATCGLDAPTKNIKVLFASQDEYNQLKTMTFASSGVVWTPSGALSGDMDLTGLDFLIANGLTVDIAGHHLKIAGSVVSSATSETTLTSAAADAILEIFVTNGSTNAVANVKIAGGKNLQVWKTGAGMLSMDKGQTFGGEGVFSFIVKEGQARKANLDGALLGAQYSSIRVEAGAQLDIRGRKYWDYDYYISGDGPDGQGALVNHVSNSSTYSGDGHLRHIYLEADATIGGSVIWALNFSQASKKYHHKITFNNHTLTLGGANKIYWVRLDPQDSGRLVVNKSEVYGASPDFSNVDVEVKGVLDSSSGDYFKPVKSLKFDQDAQWNGWGDPATAATTVLETYRPSTNAMPSVTLGAEGHLNPVLDLSTQVATLDGSGLSFYGGATVTVLTGDRDISGANKKLVSWDAPPAAGVRFKLLDSSKGGLRARNDGLYLTQGLSVIVR